MTKDLTGRKKNGQNKRNDKQEVVDSLKHNTTCYT